MDSWITKNNYNMLQILCDGDTSYEAREKAESLLIDFDGVLSRIYEKNAMRQWRTYVDGHNRLVERMDKYIAKLPNESPNDSLAFLQRAGILKLLEYAKKNSPTWSAGDEVQDFLEESDERQRWEAN